MAGPARSARGSPHEEAADFYGAFCGRGGTAYTTDYVLDETITLLFRRLSFSEADASLEKIEAAEQSGYLRIEHIGPARFDRAKALRRKYQDKSDISFTDFSSMSVMDELKIEDVLTEDAHFEHVGMGFRCWP
ncbi:MAG: nucleic acid-binding protein [Bacteroidetes bacterium QS_9_68_14]|nr:MAG: nucleic acid-binding protein [Bacteroidetes bacterium QS_9_68_14]